MEQGEVHRLEAPTENQGRQVDPDKASGGEAHPGFGRVQSGHRQQASLSISAELLGSISAGRLGSDRDRFPAHRTDTEQMINIPTSP